MKKKFTMTQKEAQLVVDAIVAHELMRDGSIFEKCPLCEIYDVPYDQDMRCERGGERCPVSKYSGNYNCYGTPYWTSPESRKNQKMIEFGLKMLDDAGYEIVEE